MSSVVLGFLIDNKTKKMVIFQESWVGGRACLCYPITLPPKQLDLKLVLSKQNLLLQVFMTATNPEFSIAKQGSS